MILIWILFRDGGVLDLWAGWNDAGAGLAWMNWRLWSCSLVWLTSVCWAVVHSVPRREFCKFCNFCNGCSLVGLAWVQSSSGPHAQESTLKEFN